MKESKRWPSRPQDPWGRLVSYVKAGDGGCLLFTGYVNPRTGYGQMRHLGRRWQPHRLSWVLRYGDIDPRMALRHACRQRNCINVDHMELYWLNENAGKVNRGE